MSRNGTEHSLCAVVVSYRPEASFFDRLKTLVKQVDEIVVVDNGSSSEVQRQLLALQVDPRYKTICHDRNVGIAAALNLGVEFALDNGFEWIATFDQDSEIGENYFEEMFETYQKAAHRDGIALISPTYVDRGTGVRIRSRKRGGGLLANMTSGSLIPASVFARLGLFDQSLFIDAVDKEFCLRAHRCGMTIVESPAVLSHSLGRTTRHRFLWISFGATNHAPARRYYIMRNSVNLLWRYSSDRDWVVQELKWLLADAVKIAVVEEYKLKKFRAMAFGFIDALRGKMGKQVEL